MWQTPYGYGDGGYGLMHGGGGWLGMGLHSLFWVVVLIAIVMVIVWAVRAANQPAGQNVHAGNPSARELLDTRYANGEIEREDYLARKKDLEG